jgi:hypothetical protein
MFRVAPFHSYGSNFKIDVISADVSTTVESKGLLSMSDLYPLVTHVNARNCTDALRPASEEFYPDRWKKQQSILSFLGLMFWLIFSCSTVTSALGQEPIISAHGDYKPAEADIVHPIPSAPLVSGDQIAAIMAFRKAVNLTGLWCGLDATGALSTVEDGKPVQGNVSLSQRHAQYSRLDLTTSKGERLYRAAGPIGSLENAAGIRRSLDLGSSELGWFTAARILSTAVVQEQAWVDDGLVQIDGTAYRKVTYYGKVGKLIAVPSAFRTAYAIDFYFDPQTHLLAKTADLYRFPGSRQLDLRVMIFDAYKPEADLLLPHALTLAINGQRVWSLSFESMASTTCTPDQTIDTTAFFPKN